jgi:hypothetical protein
VTVAVAAELAGVDPPALAAVTTERMVLPTSLAWSVYVLEVAPEILMQLPPPLLQSCHWYAYDVGLPLQLPLLVLRVWPWTVWPVTPGGAELAGAAGAELPGRPSTYADAGPALYSVPDEYVAGNEVKPEVDST